MATISGKRFQITDGAATPTNLFPYTVTEAVYGLSTVIENAKRAAVSAAATSAASLYLPLTGGTLYSTANVPLVLSTETANSYIQFYASNARKSELGYHSSYGVFLWNAVSTKMLRLQDDGGLTYDGNTLYHSGNSNKSDVAWSASSLKLTNTGGVYINGSGGVATDILRLNGSNNCLLGSGLNSVPSGGTLTIRGVNIYFDTSALNGSWANKMIINSSGNVGIGTASPRAKLSVFGNCIIGASTSPTGMLKIVGADNSASSYLIYGSQSSENTIFYVTNTGVLTTTGDQTISSDINLKTHFNDIALTSEQIANAPAVSFDWKDGHGHSFGSIAQYWKPLVPEAVLGEEGSYTLAYSQLATVLGINNGKAIFKLEQHETEQDKEIRELKAALGRANEKIKGLEKKVKRLMS